MECFPVYEKSTESACRRLLHLTAVVVVRVLRNTCVRDTGNARIVCRWWKRAVDTNELALWEAWCNTLELPRNFHLREEKHPEQLFWVELLVTFVR